MLFIDNIIASWWIGRLLCIGLEIQLREYWNSFNKTQAAIYDISMGTAQYHLEKLEKIGRVVSTRHGFYKHYFPAGIFKENEREILKVLGQETAREILLFIIVEQAPTQTEIANRIGISPASVNWYIRRLIEIMLITELRDGRYKSYQLRDRAASTRYITVLMRNYYPNIWERWSNRLDFSFLIWGRY
jgi:DNA-binding CsgD family transcriptional regulator